MSVLAASTTEPSITLHKASDLQSVMLGSSGSGSGQASVASAPRLHRAVSAATFYFFVGVYFAASVALFQLWVTSGVFTLQAYFASRFVVARAAYLAASLSQAAWTSSSVARLRKKLAYEFAGLVLGHGNVIILAVFWPGWLVNVTA